MLPYFEKNETLENSEIRQRCETDKQTNKRIAELQQTAGPLKLDVSKFEMAVSRSNVF